MRRRDCYEGGEEKERDFDGEECEKERDCDKRDAV